MCFVWATQTGCTSHMLGRWWSWWCFELIVPWFRAIVEQPIGQKQRQWWSKPRLLQLRHAYTFCMTRCQRTHASSNPEQRIDFDKNCWCCWAGQIIYLSTESASVLGVLGDFNLLDHLTQGGTIPSTILASDSNLLCTLCLKLHTILLILFTLGTHKHNLATNGGYICNKIRRMYPMLNV